MSRRPTMEGQRAMLGAIAWHASSEAGVCLGSTLARECGGRWRATLDVLVAKGLVEDCPMSGNSLVTGWRLTPAGDEARPRPA